MCHHAEQWPQPPIWPQDLPIVGELLDEDAMEALRRRLVHLFPRGPLVDFQRVLPWPPSDN